jgi:hypothetical protein
LLGDAGLSRGNASSGMAYPVAAEVGGIGTNASLAPMFSANISDTPAFVCPVADGDDGVTAPFGPSPPRTPRARPPPSTLPQPWQPTRTTARVASPLSLASQPPSARAMTLSALLFPAAWRSRADRDMSVTGAAASISGVATMPGTPRPLWAPHVRLALPALQTVQPLLAAFS